MGNLMKRMKTVDLLFEESGLMVEGVSELSKLQPERVEAIAPVRDLAVTASPLRAPCGLLHVLDADHVVIPANR